MTTQYLHFYLHILILLTTIYYLQPLPLQELTFRRLHLPFQITVMVCRRFLPCIFCVLFHKLAFPRINPTLRATTSVLRFYFYRTSQIFYASPSCLKLSTSLHPSFVRHLCTSVRFSLKSTLALFSYFHSVSITILTPVFVNTILNLHLHNI